MTIQTRAFIASLPIVESDYTATREFQVWLLQVNEFIQQAAVVSTWGGIGGALSSQTDLQAALDGKATAAQGLLADSAVQPGDNVSSLTNDPGYLTAWAPPAVRNESVTPYTLVLGDANTVVRFTALDAAVTVPLESSVAYPVGTVLTLRCAGAGTPSLITTGLTINGAVPALTTHTEFSLRKVGPDEWDVAG